MKCKRFLAMICCICIAFCCGTSTSAASPIEITQKTRLSSLTKEECTQFLEDMGVTIPDEVDEEFDYQRIIVELEKNPDKMYFMSKPATIDFIENIRVAVKEYLNQPMLAGYYTSTGYVLQQSTLWRENLSMLDYNCYAYALGRTDGRYAPGGFCGESCQNADSAYFYASLVKDDLQKTLGYNCVKIDSNLPTYSASSPWTAIIAVRGDFDEIATSGRDFHFAKLTANGWLHKPGAGGILKFNEAPDDDVSWIAEYYNVETRDCGRLGYDYESEIQYIYYKPNHTETYTGNNYHSGSRHYCQYRYTCGCSENGKTVWKSYACSGNPCITPNSITPPSETSR